MIWILILYDGPLGRERENFDFKLSMLGQWTEIAIDNLEAARNSKIAFIGNPKPIGELSKNISPYFRDLLPLAEKWRHIFRERWNANQNVDFDTLLHVTDDFLETMEPEDPPDKITERLDMQAEKDALRLPLPVPAEKPTHLTVPGKKRAHGDIRSMGDLPISTLHKRLKA